MSFAAVTAGQLGEWLPLADLSATQTFGAWLAQQADSTEPLLLEGELGAGKTSLVQGLARELGVKGQVTSPTFALCNILQGTSRELHHYDLYRIESLERLAAIGFEDSLEEDCLVLVEWPRLGEAFYRGSALCVRMEHDGEARRVRYGRMRAQDFFRT